MELILGKIHIIILIPICFKINIVNSLNSLNDVPFSLSVSGKITLTSSIDYETQADYLLKIVVKVNIILFLYNYSQIL
jgi:hypothetical protein